MKRLLIVVMSALFSFGIAYAVVAMVSQSGQDGPQVAYAQWDSTAHGVDEQTAEADVIVRAQVVKVHPTRALVFVLPLNAQRGAFKADVIPHTDADVRVLEVFKGDVSVGQTITLTQTGGRLPRTDLYPKQNLMLAGDPLYIEGGTHVLFLQDISGNPVQAPDRELYRTGNPASRYDLQGDTAVTHVEFGANALPGSLKELTAQIRRAVAR